MHILKEANRTTADLFPLSDGPSDELRKPVEPGGRVLVIDDEQPLLRSYQRILQKTFEVTLFGRATEAVELLRHDRDFDVILCDLLMPEMNGAGFYEAVAELAPELLERIVFCSGGPVVPDLHKFIASVDNVRLEKPIGVHELRAIIAEVRDRHRRD